MQLSTRCSLHLHTINIQVTLKQGWLIQAICWIKIKWLQTQDFLTPATNKAIVIYRGTYLRDFNIITLQECKCAISTSSRELHETRNNNLSFSHDPKVHGTNVINVILCPQVHDQSVRVLFIRWKQNMPSMQLAWTYCKTISCKIIIIIMIIIIIIETQYSYSH